MNSALGKIWVLLKRLPEIASQFLIGMVLKFLDIILFGLVILAAYHWAIKSAPKGTLWS